MKKLYCGGIEMHYNHIAKKYQVFDFICVKFHNLFKSDSIFQIPEVQMIGYFL